MRTDQIRREIELRAPIEQVWKAITSADELAQWFGDIAAIDLRPGGHAKFGWSEFNGITHAVIDVVEEPTRFAFRWDVMKDTSVEELSTTVEFRLEATDGGTRLTMVESGFASLPDDQYEDRFKENTSGWDAELVDLVDFLTQESVVG